MKKINWKQLLIPTLLFVFILLLSGCGEDYVGLAQDCNDDGGVYNMYLQECVYEETYYTQDQVDTLLQEQAKWITEMMYDNYIEYDEDNNILYSNCLIVDGIKQCNIVINLNEDYITAEEYQELLNRIEVLEGE